MKKIIIIIFFIFTSFSFSFTGKGSGTEKNPFQITNVYQLSEIDNKSDAFYILMNDIDASDTRNWNITDHDDNRFTPDESMGFTPIYDFSGSLDGRGYVIKNLYINRPLKDYIGLFTRCIGNCKVQKVGIENCDITGNDLVGAMFGYADGSRKGLITQCYTTGKVTGNRGIGGFGGYDQSVDIINCYSYCLVYISSKYDSAAASFCGSDYPFIFQCYTTGKVITSKKVTAFGVENGRESYWDIETTGIPYDRGRYGSKGLSTNDMKVSINYPGWDFKNVWYIKEEEDYPKLRAFLHPAKVEETGLTAYKLTIDITPSPATSTAQIRYSAPYSNIIKITITNIFGEEVAVPVGSQSHEAGHFSSELDVSAFPSGVYFCVLQTPAGAISKQFVVVH
ncbi:MAG: hypothetical protein HW421_4110 [Ignavibacteria bacterium]|nr:hypothetical protein [Ignavibacteria bacterium]